MTVPKSKGSYVAQVMLLAISVAALSLIAAFMAGHYSKASKSQEDAQASSIASVLAGAMLEARDGGPGYSVVIDLPPEVGGSPYRLRIDEGASLWIDANVISKGNNVRILEEHRPYTALIVNAGGRQLRRELPVSVVARGSGAGGRVRISNTIVNGSSIILLEGAE